MNPVNDQEYINIEMEQFKIDNMKNYLHKNILILGLDQQLSTELLKKIVHDNLGKLNGIVCTNINNMECYKDVEPEKLYKGYNKLFNNRFFRPDSYLIFDNIELGLQQCYQICDTLNETDMFFINCRKSVMNADPIVYDYIFVHDYTLKTYNKYFKNTILDDYEYFEHLNKELKKDNCIVVYKNDDKSFMYLKTN
jgi:hypothetical protein